MPQLWQAELLLMAHMVLHLQPTGNGHIVHLRVCVCGAKLISWQHIVDIAYVIISGGTSDAVMQCAS